MPASHVPCTPKADPLNYGCVCSEDHMSPPHKLQIQQFLLPHIFLSMQRNMDVQEAREACGEAPQ